MGGYDVLRRNKKKNSGEGQPLFGKNGHVLVVFFLSVVVARLTGMASGQQWSAAASRFRPRRA